MSSTTLNRLLEKPSSVQLSTLSTLSVVQASDDIPAPEPTPPSPPVPPDGGLRACLGSFQVEYESGLLKNKTSSQISWILTFQLFLMFFLSQPVGLVVDMFGSRIVLIPASILTVCGLVALSFCREYYQIFLAQGLCFGIGAAGIFMPGFVVAGQYFRRKRALAIGIVASGSSVGGVIFPIFLARLFKQVGFASAIRWSALLIGILLVFANLLVFSPNKPKGWGAKRSLIRFSVFKNPDFVIYVAGAFFFFWGLFGPFNFLPSFAAKSQDTAYVALYAVSILNASSIPGRIVPSHLSDRYGHLATMTVMSYLAAISILVIWLPINARPSLAGLIIFALTFGFSSGAFVSLMTPCLVDICGGHTHDLGAMLGTFMSIIAFASLTGLPTQAAISDHSANDSLTGLIIFSGCSMMFGAVLINVAWLKWRLGSYAKGKAAR
ncbi:hypothetical protein MMC07_006660 [Pseudocyphellaria aurata]|nr:hypothetical protein [Pseudocyphellaria aurata]